MLFLWYFRVETNWQFVEWKMAMASIIPIISLYPPGKLVPRRVYHIFGNLWSRLFLRSLAFSHSKNLMPFLSTKKIWKDVHMCLRCLYIATCGYLCISISTVCKYRYIYIETFVIIMILKNMWIQWIQSCMVYRYTVIYVKIYNNYRYIWTVSRPLPYLLSLTSCH